MTKQMTTANDDNDDDLGVEWKIAVLHSMVCRQVESFMG
jgi:hypothetical protein